jgi:hypothetical protein
VTKINGKVSMGIWKKKLLALARGFNKGFEEKDT